jgi:DNA-directed RNA polymerase specialized sigma24 family protein
MSVERTREVTTRKVKHITRAAAYANSDDFFRIFDENMNNLYLLAFLLTADHARAEQCFVSGLEDAVEGNPVFREWAHSWGSRTIIQNAVRVVRPRPGDARGSLRSNSEDSDYKALPAERQTEISAVLGLEPLERMVYVMTVLEHYSDHQCSLLLGCARRDVFPLRTRALEQTGCQAEMQERHVPIAG